MYSFCILDRDMNSYEQTLDIFDSNILEINFTLTLPVLDILDILQPRAESRFC